MEKTNQRAAQEGDVKHFLKPYFSFRLYAQFKKDKKKVHFYGNEHQVTYQQLKFAQAKSIILNKEKGYTDLIKLVEVTWKNRLLSAVIYMRESDNAPFNIECRRYYNGEITDCNDPVISAENNFRELFYFFQNGILFITEEKPVEIDFKKEVNNALYPNT
ncbi:MAG: hypothetical protein ACOYKE_02505 [Ferruginibacter sp.]